MVSRLPAIPAINTELAAKVLTSFIDNEVRKVGFSKVVLGLSGGVDSALSLALAVRALGPTNVTAITMPYTVSAKKNIDDALALAKQYKVKCITESITPQIDAYFARHPKATMLSRGNKMARERMSILFDYSSRIPALVLGTSNKTELLLGYGTQFGDLASAINPLGDLYKTQVWALSAHLALPKQIIEKIPTADLWEGQTDEGELGFSYREADALLYQMVDLRLGDTELAALGFKPAFIATVRKRISFNQFKRRLPVIPKLSQRTIDKDFRYARDWGH